MIEPVLATLILPSSTSEPISMSAEKAVELARLVERCRTAIEQHQDVAEADVAQLAEFGFAVANLVGADEGFATVCVTDAEGNEYVEEYGDFLEVA